MIRTAVVGYGYWGPNLARNVAQLENAELTEICDENPVRLAQAESQFHGPRFSRNLLYVLSNPQIDAVVIATPAGMHYDMVKAAIAHGKHVLVEKPLALALEQGQELVELASRMGTVLMVDHTYEYHPAIQAIEDIVRSGELGQIWHASSVRLNLGIVRQNVNVLWNLAPHDISIILRLFAEEPNSVEATGGCYLQNGIEDVAAVAMSFPSGRVAHIYVSWLSPRKTRELTLVGETQMLVFDETLPEARVKIYDKGIAQQMDSGSYGEFFTLRHGGIYCPHIPSHEPLRLAVEDFIHAIETGTSPRSDGEAALAVLRVLSRAEASLAQKRAEFT